MLTGLGARLTYGNVMATGAMFVALGGGAYALSGIPDRGGVFHGCVSNATGVLRVVKSARSCQKPKTVRRNGKKIRLPGEFAVSWNQQGQRGLQGVQGLQGIQGATGATGPPGPTAGATDPRSATPSATPNSQHSSTATITTSAPSKLLVSGFVPAVFVCGASSCTQSWGLYLNGAPLPGSAVDVSQGPNSTRAQTTISTVTTGLLPAGTYSLTMKDNLTNVTNSAGDPHMSVVALGG